MVERARGAAPVALVAVRRASSSEPCGSEVSPVLVLVPALLLLAMLPARAHRQKTYKSTKRSFPTSSKASGLPGNRCPERLRRTWCPVQVPVHTHTQRRTAAVKCVQAQAQAQARIPQPTERSQKTTSPFRRQRRGAPRPLAQGGAGAAAEVVVVGYPRTPASSTSTISKHDPRRLPRRTAPRSHQGTTMPTSRASRPSRIPPAAAPAPTPAAHPLLRRAGDAPSPLTAAAVRSLPLQHTSPVALVLLIHHWACMGSPSPSLPAWGWGWAWVRGQICPWELRGDEAGGYMPGRGADDRRGQYGTGRDAMRCDAGCS